MNADNDNTKRNAWIHAMIWTGAVAVAAALLVIGPQAMQEEEPCLDPDEEFARVDREELRARHDEALRRAERHRNAARLLDDDTRWGDPEQRPFLDEAARTTAAMVEGFEEEATTTGDLLECVEGGD
jgi:hypothetical protein